MEIYDLVRKECLRRGLSHRTITTYVFCLKQFFKKYRKDPKYVTKADIHEYLDGLIEKEAAGNTINVHHSALTFFFEEILHKRLLIHIKYSKTPKTLPTVLIQEETTQLFMAITNKKHQLMIKLMYGAGLRVSEIVNLRVNDLDLQRGYGWVRKGKGNKDRMFVVPDSLLEELKSHMISDNLQDHNYLFYGRKGNHIHTRSVQEIVKKAAKRAGIKKNVHPHTLRHSFATHLIENGYDVASVQSLLGHNSMGTTMRYLHMAPSKMINVRSPLDTLNEKC